MCVSVQIIYSFIRAEQHKAAVYRCNIDVCVSPRSGLKERHHKRAAWTEIQQSGVRTRKGLERLHASGRMKRNEGVIRECVTITRDLCSLARPKNLQMPHTTFSYYFSSCCCRVLSRTAVTDIMRLHSSVSHSEKETSRNASRAVLSCASKVYTGGCV